MNNRVLAGPDSSAQWEGRQVAGWGAATPSLTLLLIPDASSNLQGTTQESNVYYYVPKVQHLQQDAAHNPIFSLTLVLSRQPNAGDRTIYPLIQQGLLGLSLTLGVPDELIARLADTAQAEYKPLFAREVMFSLEVDKGVDPLVSASGSGAGASAALSVTLDRDQALGVLSALDGAASGLTVRTEISYRTAAINQKIRLTGSWAAIIDHIRDQFDPKHELELSDLQQYIISLADLQRYFADMLKANIISVSQISPTGVELLLKYMDSESPFSMFMLAAISFLHRETPMLGREDPRNQYTLHRQPYPMERLDVKQTFSSPETKSLELVAPLEEVIGGALDNLDRNRFISLIGPSSGSDRGFCPVPRLIRVERGFRGSQGDAYPLQLAVTGSSIMSLALALTPDTLAVPTAHELLRSDFIHGGGKLDWMADDLVIQPPVGQPIYSLPVVDDPSASLWHDRVNPSRYWYTPSFVVVQPAPNQDPATSPFLFMFSRTGDIAGGISAPGVNRTVRFTLQQVMPDVAKTALQGLDNPEVHPVPLDNLSVLLDILFSTRQRIRPKPSCSMQELYKTEIRSALRLIYSTSGSTRVMVYWPTQVFGRSRRA